MVLQVLFCIALARFVTTGLAGMLRSRRGKDFAAFLIIPLFALYESSPRWCRGWPPRAR